MMESALILVAVLVALEIASRAFLARRGRYHVWLPFSRSRHELDREALPMLEEVVEWRVNADGERGDPLPDEWTDTYRVLVIGGSTTECYFIDQASTWPAVVQEALRRPEHLARLGVGSVHVGNLGRSVTTSDQMREVFARVLDRYERLDAVVILGNASDIVRWTHLGTPAVWPDTGPPVSDMFAAHPEGPHGWTPRRLAARRLLGGQRQRLLRPVDRRRDVGRRMIELRRRRADARLIETLPDTSGLLDHFETHLAACLRELVERDLRVLFVANLWLDGELEPSEEALLWNFGHGRPYERPLERYYAHPAICEVLREFHDRGLAIAEAAGCETLDLMPSMESSARTYYDLLHHTPLGNHILGEAIAAHLASSSVERGQSGGDDGDARAIAM